MARQARQHSASGVYHIFSRGNSQMEIFHDGADNLTFLRFLSETVDDDFQVAAYCLMGNHFHLLVVTSKEKEDILENKMKSLLVRYVEYYNKRYNRVGILFQGRFKSQPVETVPYFCRLIRYIHNNPVVAKICEKMEDYPWSSYRNYFCSEDSSKKKYFEVNQDYALRLHSLEWFREWHGGIERNAAGMLDDRYPVPISDNMLITMYGYSHSGDVHQISSLPPDQQRKAIRHLCIEEGGKPNQVARLTGVSKGLIARYLA